MWCVARLGTIYTTYKTWKHPWRSVDFSIVAGFKPATLLKLTLFHGCFSRFLNCTNGTKSRNAPHLEDSGVYGTVLSKIFFKDDTNYELLKGKVNPSINSLNAWFLVVTRLLNVWNSFHSQQVKRNLILLTETCYRCYSIKFPRNLRLRIDVGRFRKILSSKERLIAG